MGGWVRERVPSYRSRRMEKILDECVDTARWALELFINHMLKKREQSSASSRGNREGNRREIGGNRGWFGEIGLF